MKKQIVIRVISFTLLLVCGLSLYFHIEQSFFTRPEIVLIAIFIIATLAVSEVANLLASKREKNLSKDFMKKRMKGIVVTTIFGIGAFGMSLIFIRPEEEIFSGNKILFATVYGLSFAGILLSIVLSFIWRLINCNTESE